MENDATEVAEFSNYCRAKVHRSICLQLVKFNERIAQIFKAIESGRPRSNSVIPAVCLLRVSMEKAKSLVQECSESSKLYLAIKGEKILSKSKKIRADLESSLSQIKNMVPLLLAAKICGIIHDLRQAKFYLDYSDSEAGKIVLSLIHQDITTTSTENEKELEPLRIAASNLELTSPVALLIERRSIKKSLRRIKNDTLLRTKKILRYLHYLLEKYGNNLITLKRETKEEQEEVEEEAEPCRGSLEPPDEYKCPISLSLMYEPSIIASGKTFERVLIEKWFDEGNDTCPVTNLKLDHLIVTPNCMIKSLIEKWCSKHRVIVPNPCLERLPVSFSRSKTMCSSSTASFGSNVDKLGLQVCNSFGSDLYKIEDEDEDDDEFKDLDNSRGSKNSQESTLAFLSSLGDLSWESQCKVIKDVKNQMEGKDQAHLLVASYNFVNPLIKFMKDASKSCDVRAVRDGAELLLAILRESRNEIPQFQGDMIYLLTSYLDSEITGKALAILEVLSYEHYCMSMMLASGILPSILKLLEETPQAEEFQAPSMKILCNLSINADIGYHMLYLDYIPTLVRFMGHDSLSRHSIEIIKNLCSIEDAKIAICENKECVDGIGRLLSSDEAREHAVEVLLLLCHNGAEFCRMVMTESVVESLARISAKNGSNSRVKLIAMELLELFGDKKDGSKPSVRNARLDIDGRCKSRTKKSGSRAFWLLSRDKSRFAKSR